MNRPIRSAASLILTVLLLAACRTPGAERSASAGASSGTGATASEDATASPESGFEGHPAAGLAFLQWPDSNSPASYVFVADEEGTVRQVSGVSRQSAGASLPVWSPDGDWIAFGPPKTGAGLTFEVGVVKADGTEERVVAEGAHPQWSPDGTRILFEAVDEITLRSLSMHVVDVATGEVTDLGQGTNPRWLPDGQRISYLRPFEDPGNGQPVVMEYVIDTVSAKGGEPEELVPAEAIAWSPDGSSCLIVKEGVISLAHPDGSNARVVVNGWDPVWSPDGNSFVFAYEVDTHGMPVLAVVDLEGHATWSGISGGRPAWSPDGTRIAVELAADEPTVVVLDAATGEALWETAGAQPAWSS